MGKHPIFEESCFHFQSSDLKKVQQQNVTIKHRDSKLKDCFIQVSSQNL